MPPQPPPMANVIAPLQHLLLFLHISFTQYESHTTIKLGDVKSKWNYAQQKFRTNIFDKYIYIYRLIDSTKSTIRRCLTLLYYYIKEFFIDKIGLGHVELMRFLISNLEDAISKAEKVIRFVQYIRSHKFIKNVCPNFLVDTPSM